MYRFLLSSDDDDFEITFESETDFGSNFSYLVLSLCYCLLLYYCVMLLFVVVLLFCIPLFTVICCFQVIPDKLLKPI